MNMKILLNLLPEEKKLSIERGLHARILLWQFFLLFLLELLFLGILITIIMLLSTELKNTKTLSESSHLATQNEKKILEKYESKFQGINQATSVVGKITANHLYFSQVYRILDQVQPKEVLLQKIATTDRLVNLVGVAETRESLLLFEEQLKNSTCVESVNVPLSNLFSQTNIAFQIEFTLTMECLKKNTL